MMSKERRGQPSIHINFTPEHVNHNQLRCIINYRRVLRLNSPAGHPSPVLSQEVSCGSFTLSSVVSCVSPT